MSDLRLQNLLQQYLKTGTPEDAASFAREYARMHGIIETSYIQDMNVCSFFLGNLELEVEDPDYQAIVTWIDRHASLIHTAAYENIIYIGAMTNGEPFAKGRRLNQQIQTLKGSSETGLTPLALIPIIEEAVKRDYAYISFYVE